MKQDSLALLKPPAGRAAAGTPVSEIKPLGPDCR
jgi:hypothetical protein